MNEIIEWIKTIVISVAIALFITMFIRPTMVKGDSMQPTLEPYNYLIINKVTYMFEEPKRSDIIVFKTDLTTMDGKTKDLIKRIIGVAGDHIVITDGKVYVNDELQNEEYTSSDFTHGEIDIIVPEGKLFVLGDNRPKSLDSRSDSVGLVNIDNVKGKILVRLYPFNEIGGVN